MKKLRLLWLIMIGDPMQDKKERILETALKLFARKGFHSTSMQEIAEESNVAKGSLYTYFQSKDDLLYSIFSKYFRKFQANIHNIEKLPLDEREKFYRQILSQMEEIAQQRDFIMIHLQEQMIPMNEKLRSFLQKANRDTIRWVRKKIIAIYGKRI